MYFRRSRFQGFAKDMLASVGLTTDVEMFFKDARVTGMIQNAYLKLEVKVNAYKKKLLERDRKEINVQEMKELFTKEVRCDFEKNLSMSIRADQSRGEVTEEYLSNLKDELSKLSLGITRRFQASLDKVEREVIGHCEYIVDRHVGRFRRASDCGDDYYDDDDDDDCYNCD